MRYSTILATIVAVATSAPITVNPDVSVNPDITVTPDVNVAIAKRDQTVAVKTSLIAVNVDIENILAAVVSTVGDVTGTVSGLVKALEGDVKQLTTTLGVSVSVKRQDLSDVPPTHDSDSSDSDSDSDWVSDWDSDSSDSESDSDDELPINTPIKRAVTLNIGSTITTLKTDIANIKAVPALEAAVANELAQVENIVQTLEINISIQAKRQLVGGVVSDATPVVSDVENIVTPIVGGAVKTVGGVKRQVVGGVVDDVTPIVGDVENIVTPIVGGAVKTVGGVKRQIAEADGVVGDALTIVDGVVNVSDVISEVETLA